MGSPFHSIVTPRRRRGRNFFDEDVENEESFKLEETKKDIAWGNKWGKYFDHRDIRKQRHLAEKDPEAFQAWLDTDPELYVAQQVEDDKEMIRNNFSNNGMTFIKDLCSDYQPENLVLDEGTETYHFKPKNFNNIKEFNKAIEDECRMYDQKKKLLEDQYIDKTQVILAERNREKDVDKSFEDDEIVQVSSYYDKKIKKITKKQEQTQATDMNVNKPINSEYVLSRLQELKIKKEITDDMIRFKHKGKEKDNVDFLFTQDWFKRNEHRIPEFAEKYKLDKYKKAKFIYRNAYMHYFCFIPSAGGKTTLTRKFGRYVADYDRMLDYENDQLKFKFLMGYSKYYEDWVVGNNYWKEMFLTYEYKFRGKVILCHGPAQIPDGAISTKDQGLIILPSVKKWNLREFKSNYEYLKNYKAEDPRFQFNRIELHYRYYFYIIFNFFELINFIFKEE